MIPTSTHARTHNRTRPLTSLLRVAVGVTLLGLAQESVLAQNIYRVDDNAPGPIHDGSSWTNAHLSPQDALNRTNPPVASGDQIWVAEGTYSAGSSPADTHTIPPGVGFYGAFNGTEAELLGRKGLPSKTILTGDLDGSASRSVGDSFHIITVPLNTQATTIDGFRIEYGNATTSASIQKGAGILINSSSAVTVRNCIIQQCFAEGEGAGVYGYRVALGMSFCTLRENTTPGLGGGMRLEECYGDVFNVLFANNRADTSGGGLHADVFSGLPGSGLTICNALFRSNSSNLGGGLYLGDLRYRNAIVANCTFSANETFEDANGLGSLGAGIYLESPESWNASIYNSIIWGNVAERSGPETSTIEGPGASSVTVKYSDTETVTAWPIPGGGSPNVGNINADPVFVSPSTSEFRLQNTSPCLDAGDDSLLPKDVLDLNGNGNPFPIEAVPYELVAGNPREFDDPMPDTGSKVDPPVGITDMGCYERGVGIPG